MILLACAVEAELAYLRPPESVETLVTGVGPVEAACAVSAALAARRYDFVVNAGLAGAFDGAAKIGDGVVIAGDSMEVDLENGDALHLPRGERTVEQARSDPSVVERLQAAGFKALRGITVARVTATDETAGRLSRRHGAQAESMEGFAVLRAAERAGVAAVELRGISNRCGARERSLWSFEAGIAGLARIAEAFFAMAEV